MGVLVIGFEIANNWSTSYIVIEYEHPIGVKIGSESRDSRSSHRCTRVKKFELVCARGGQLFSKTFWKKLIFLK